MSLPPTDPVPARLSRAATGGPPAAPVRIVHLGLGNFFRAHQAWYTDQAPDAADWGIAAFTGRSAGLAAAMTAQDGLYTLLTRAADGDSSLIIAAVSAAHPGPDTTALLGYLADPAVAVITLTVTEAGYQRGPDGRLDQQRPGVVADLVALRGSDQCPALQTVPGRLVAGLRARRAAGGGSIAIVPCDNLPENGRVIAAVLTDLAAALDQQLAGWIATNVSFVTTMVDRITPATTASDLTAARALTGLADEVPVVTEPFREWVLSGHFPAGRPAWEAAGATFVDDIAPFEERKLWLLNGGHSLLAYLGGALGHQNVAEAMADPWCRRALTTWWQEAAEFLTLPPADLQTYQRALVQRFTNPGIRHLLAQIAADGSQKLPVRILPALRRHRAAGGMPTAAVLVLAGWILHLRRLGASVTDAAAASVVPAAAGPLDQAARRVIAILEPGLADDAELEAAVISACRELGERSAALSPAESPGAS